MDRFRHVAHGSRTPGPRAVGLVTMGLLCGFLVSRGWAAIAPPTHHKGLKVEVLGYVPAHSVEAQVGLTGHRLLLRRITIEPGGDIAKHSAATTPAVVHMISGTWIEGRSSGETTHHAGDTFIEDENTVHWFYNRGKEAASAYVCDIKPAKS